MGPIGPNTQHPTPNTQHPLLLYSRNFPQFFTSSNFLDKPSGIKYTTPTCSTVGTTSTAGMPPFSLDPRRGSAPQVHTSTEPASQRSALEKGARMQFARKRTGFTLIELL